MTSAKHVDYDVLQKTLKLTQDFLENFSEKKEDNNVSRWLILNGERLLEVCLKYILPLEWLTIFQVYHNIIMNFLILSLKSQSLSLTPYLPYNLSQSGTLRYLAKQGLTVQQVRNRRTLRHLFLFRDIIICAKQRISGRWVV